jgi:hypothetical protein
MGLSAPSDTLLAAAHGWYLRAIDMCEPGHGIGGYRYRILGDDGGPRMVPMSSILNGATGTALALLAAATNVSPDWDRLLLLSPRRSSPSI